MFKMGCSMARKILPSGSKSATGGGGGDLSGDHPANKSSKSANETPAAAAAAGANKAKTGDELNDFSKLQDDPRLPLNVRQIFKITKSWKAIARTMSKTGTAMFLNLFEQNQDLFYLFSRFQHLKGKELHESMELREHAATVMSTLDQSISSLSDYDSFVAYLHSIGKLHRKVPGFKREHFWKIEQPFLKAVKQTLDERCNETIEEIYKIAIKLIIETIAEGYGEEKEGAAPADIGDNLKGPGSGGGNGNADGNGAGSPNAKPNDLTGQNNGGRGGNNNNNCSNSQRPAGNKRTHSGQPSDHQDGSTTTTASLDNDKSVLVSCAGELEREKRGNFYDQADRESREERETDNETGSISSFKTNGDQSDHNNNDNCNQDNSMTKLSHELISLTGKLIEISKKSKENVNSRKTRTRRKRNKGEKQQQQQQQQQHRPQNHDENLRIPQALSEFSAKLDELLHSSAENRSHSGNTTTTTTTREQSVLCERKNSSNKVADCRVSPINSNGNHNDHGEATKLADKINLPNDKHDNKRSTTSENKSLPAPSEWETNVPSKKLAFNENLHRASGCPFGHKASQSNSSSVCPRRAPAGGDTTTATKTMTDDVGQTQSSKFLQRQQLGVPLMKPDATSQHKPLAPKSEHDRQLGRSRNDNNKDNRPTNYVTTAAPAACFPIGCRPTTRSGADSGQQLAHSTQVR